MSEREAARQFGLARDDTQWSSGQVEGHRPPAPDRPHVCAPYPNIEEVLICLPRRSRVHRKSIRYGCARQHSRADMVSVLLLFPDASDDLRVDVTVDGRFIEMDFGRGLEIRGGQQVEEQRTSTQNHRSGEPPIGETNRSGPVCNQPQAGQR